MKHLFTKFQLQVVMAVLPLWVMFMTLGGHWGEFTHSWFMSVTMLFGSFIAGATAEGGGAVAFPVMTLGFHLPPPVARDFSLIIQMVGMNAAAYCIIRNKVAIEWKAIRYATAGGALGVVFGLTFVVGHIPPPVVKMFFVSFWLGFGYALFRLYHNPGVKTKACIDGRCDILLLTGFLGGIVTAMTGSGLDIVTFSVLTLYFGVCERIATPTSVVIMAINTTVGACWKGLALDGIAPQAWNFWYVCVPIVVIGAPFGAILIRHASRGAIVYMLTSIIAIQFVTALLLVPQSPALLAFSATVLVLSLSFFAILAKRRTKRDMTFNAVPA